MAYADIGSRALRIGGADRITATGAGALASLAIGGTERISAAGAGTFASLTVGGSASVIGPLNLGSNSTDNPAIRLRSSVNSYYTEIQAFAGAYSQTVPAYTLSTYGNGLRIEAAGSLAAEFVQGQLAMAGAVRTGAASGDIIVPNSRGIRSVNGLGDAARNLISSNAANDVLIGYSAGHGYPTTRFLNSVDVAQTPLQMYVNWGASAGERRVMASTSPPAGAVYLYIVP